MAPNQGGPKGELCPKCGHSNDARDASQLHCDDCGLKLVVECPGCQSPQRAVQKKCKACGVDLPEVKSSATSVVVPKKDVYDIEVNYSGANGRYDIFCQMTKDGVGLQGEIAILGLKKDDELDGIPFPGGIKQLPTTPKGSLPLKVEFKGRRRTLTMRIDGCQANTERLIVLRGAPFVCPANANHSMVVQAVIEYNKS